MPISANFEALLATLKPEDADSLRAIAERYPEVNDGYLRQSDYSSRSAELDRQRREMAAREAENNRQIAEWEAFHEGEVQRQQAINEEMEQLRSASQNRMVTPQAQAEGDASDKLAELMRSGKFVGQDDVARMIREEATRLIKQEAQAFSEQVVKFNAASNERQMKMLRAELQHQKEFNAPLPPEFSKFMVEKNVPDPEVAYEQFVSKPRREREVEQLRSQIREEMKKEYSARAIPGAGAQTESVASPITMMRQRERRKATPGAEDTMETVIEDAAEALRARAMA